MKFKLADADNDELCLATAQGNLKLINSLLDESYSIKPAGSSGLYPIMFAANAGHLDIVKKLFPLFNNNGSRSGSSKISSLDLIVDYPENQTERPYQGITLFLAAAINNKWDIVRFLLSKIHQPNLAILDSLYQGKSLLWYATRDNEKEVIKTLLILQCKTFNTSPHDNEGVTSLFHVVIHGQWDIVNTMLRMKDGNFDTPVEKGSYRGETVLSQVCAAKKWEVVKKLIKRGARGFDMPANPNISVVTPLWSACHSHQWEIVDSMINFGAKNFDAVATVGNTRDISPFHLAVGHHKWDIALKMLNIGVKHLDSAVQVGPDRGKTALWHAACCNNFDIVFKLLEQGVSIEIKNVFTFSALKVGMEARFKEIKREHYQSLNNQKKKNEREQTEEMAQAKNIPQLFEQFRVILSLLYAAKTLFDIANGKASPVQLPRILKFLKTAVNAKINGKTALDCAIKKKNKKVEYALIKVAKQSFEVNPKSDVVKSDVVKADRLELKHNQKTLHNFDSDSDPDSEFELKKEIEAVELVKKDLQPEVSSSEDENDEVATSQVTTPPTKPLLFNQNSTIWSSTRNSGAEKADIVPKGHANVDSRTQDSATEERDSDNHADPKQHRHGQTQGVPKPRNLNPVCCSTLNGCTIL